MKQHRKLVLTTVKSTNGEAAVAIMIQDAQAMVVVDSPEDLEALAKNISRAAKDLLINQRDGGKVLYVPNGTGVREKIITGGGNNRR
jgi:formate dehydrogenase assembly factor FdhD